MIKLLKSKDVLKLKKMFNYYKESFVYFYLMLLGYDFKQAVIYLKSVDKSLPMFGKIGDMNPKDFTADQMFTESIKRGSDYANDIHQDCARGQILNEVI